MMKEEPTTTQKVGESQMVCQSPYFGNCDMVKSSPLGETVHLDFSFPFNCPYLSLFSPWNSSKNSRNSGKVVVSFHIAAKLHGINTVSWQEQEPAVCLVSHLSKNWLQYEDDTHSRQVLLT